LHSLLPHHLTLRFAQELGLHAAGRFSLIISM